MCEGRRTQMLSSTLKSVARAFLNKKRQKHKKKPKANNEKKICTLQNVLENRNIDNGASAYSSVSPCWPQLHHRHFGGFLSGNFSKAFTKCWDSTTIMYTDFYSDSHLRLFFSGAMLGLNQCCPYLDQWLLFGPSMKAKRWPLISTVQAYWPEQTWSNWVVVFVSKKATLERQTINETLFNYQSPKVDMARSVWYMWCPFFLPKNHISLEWCLLNVFPLWQFCNCSYCFLSGYDVSLQSLISAPAPQPTVFICYSLFDWVSCFGSSKAFLIQKPCPNR